MTEPGTRSPQVVWREFGNSQPFRVFLHNVPDHLLRDSRSPDDTFSTNASENLAVCNTSYNQPVVNRLLHPIRHRNSTDVPSFPDQVNNGPVILPALNMVKSQSNEFSATKPAPEEDCQDGSVPFALHGVHAGKLPQGAGLLHGQPISKPHAQLFRSFHATDSSGQIRAKQSGVRRLIGESSNSCQPHVDGARCEQPIFEMNPVARHHRFVERQARL